MGFVKNMQEHDLTLLQTLDGQYIVHTSRSGKMRVIDGMLQEHTQMIPGGNVEVVATYPVLSARTIDLDDVNIGDKIAIDSQTYEVAVIRPDNEGIAELVLEKLSSTF